MRYAVIADVHGNHPALQAVLQEAKKAGAEQFLFLGDYMTDFPFTNEIVAVLRSLPHAVFVSGNGSGIWIPLTPPSGAWSNMRRCS